MALIKKYKCMNVGNCKDANKTIFDIPVGEKLECPTCHKEMLVEVKTGGNMKMVIIAAVIVLGGGAGAYFGGLFGGTPSDSTIALKSDSIAVVDPVVNQVDTTTAVVNETPNTEAVDKNKDKGKDKEIPESTKSTTSCNLDYAAYEGPMSGGKPHGIGGTLLLKKNHSIDLKDAKGGMLNMSPGDKIVNTKFTNGVLNQGELQRKTGERTYFVIGG